MLLTPPRQCPNPLDILVRDAAETTPRRPLLIVQEIVDSRNQRVGLSNMPAQLRKLLARNDTAVILRNDEFAKLSALSNSAFKRANQGGVKFVGKPWSLANAAFKPGRDRRVFSDEISELDGLPRAVAAGDDVRVGRRGTPEKPQKRGCNEKANRRRQDRGLPDGGVRLWHGLFPPGLFTGLRASLAHVGKSEPVVLPLSECPRRPIKPRYPSAAFTHPSGVTFQALMPLWW